MKQLRRADRLEFYSNFLQFFGVKFGHKTIARRSVFNNISENVLLPFGPPVAICLIKIS